MSAWVGCGECDLHFSCHGGKTRCVRLAVIPIEGSTAYHQTADALIAMHDGGMSPAVFRAMLIYELAMAARRAREATELRLKGSRW